MLRSMAIAKGRDEVKIAAEQRDVLRGGAQSARERSGFELRGGRLDKAQSLAQSHSTVGDSIRCSLTVVFSAFAFTILLLTHP